MRADARPGRTTGPRAAVWTLHARPAIAEAVQSACPVRTDSPRPARLSQFLNILRGFHVRSTRTDRLRPVRIGRADRHRLAVLEQPSRGGLEAGPHRRDPADRL